MAPPPRINISIECRGVVSSSDADDRMSHTTIILVARASTFSATELGELHRNSAAGLIPSERAPSYGAIPLGESELLQAHHAPSIPRCKSFLAPTWLVFQHTAVWVMCFCHVASLAIGLYPHFSRNAQFALLPDGGTPCKLGPAADSVEGAAILATLLIVLTVAILPVDHWIKERQCRILSEQMRTWINGTVNSKDIGDKPSSSLCRAEACPIAKHLIYVDDRRITETSVQFEEASYLAQGSCGEVHQARLAGRNGAVAVKKFRLPGHVNKRSGAEVSFAREVSVWSQLDHPNILPLTAFCHNCAGDIFWLISPFINGGNVTEYLERANPSPSIRFQLVVDTASGLAYLHGKKTCHGDLKAVNVLVEMVDGRPKALLCDFGLSEGRESQLSRLTTSSFDRKGSTRYLCPELLMTETPRRDLRSDVWAWGCVVLEIITGILPYKHVQDDRVVVCKVVGNELPAALDNLDVHDVIRGLLSRCWSPAAQRPHMWECYKILLENLR